jgi:hypothetical protein
MYFPHSNIFNGVAISNIIEEAMAWHFSLEFWTPSFFGIILLTRNINDQIFATTQLQ